MTLDIKPFVKTLKQKDPRKAREWLEQNRGGLDASDEFARGYLSALQGMVSALESGGELSVIKQLVNGGFSPERVEKLIKEAKGRLSMKFKPKDEQGFDTAWVDVLHEISGNEQK